MDKLKLCPFCGSEAKLVVFSGTAHVHCMLCLATTKVYIPLSVSDDAKKNAVEAWNKRVDNDTI